MAWPMQSAKSLVRGGRPGSCFPVPAPTSEGGAEMAELPGKALAEELIGRTEAKSRSTPFEDVIAAAGAGVLDVDAANRLIGRLWTLERMFYYVYDGWGQGLEINDFPPSMKYLFAKQIVDESTHEMLYLDLLL